MSERLEPYRAQLRRIGLDAVYMADGDMVVKPDGEAAIAGDRQQVSDESEV